MKLGSGYGQSGFGVVHETVNGNARVPKLDKLLFSAAHG